MRPRERRASRAERAPASRTDHWDVKWTPVPKESEADILPTQKELSEMGQFNQEIITQGVMLAGEGLQDDAERALLMKKAASILQARGLSVSGQNGSVTPSEQGH